MCVSKLTIIGPDNDLSPDRRQAIIWTNAGILLIGPLATNLSEILIEILQGTKGTGFAVIWTYTWTIISHDLKVHKIEFDIFWRHHCCCHSEVQNISIY